jgi:hypothetical protein
MQGGKPKHGQKNTFLSNITSFILQFGLAKFPPLADGII